MWRPQEVVRKHRDRATALWLILIAAIVVYTFLLVNAARYKSRNPSTSYVLSIYWYPGGSSNASTTCGPEPGQWESHSESVTVFLRDPTTGELSAGSQMPYSCITDASTGHTFDFMGIGLTKVAPLSGRDSFSYKPLVVFSYMKKEPTLSGVTAPFAHLSMEVAQSVNSFEVITEIDPWELAEMFGNIGGFWDLILFLWPFFFVPVVKPKSSFKFRNFLEPCTKRAQEPETTTRASARRGWTERSSRGRTFDSSVQDSGTVSRDRSVDSLESGASSRGINDLRPSRSAPARTNSPTSRR